MVIDSSVPARGYASIYILASVHKNSGRGSLMQFTNQGPCLYKAHGQSFTSNIDDVHKVKPVRHRWCYLRNLERQIVQLWILSFSSL